MKDPNPTRETYTEYTGSVGFEKKLHQTHFQGVPLKPQKIKVVRGIEYVWLFGEWRILEKKTENEQ